MHNRFNHDPWAATYDRNVAEESHPIRAGYASVLACVAAAARYGPEASVLELGAGTGNLTGQLAPCSRLICVDLSAKMWAQAQRKVVGRGAVFVCADLLEYLADDALRFDAIVSTYAVHHLTQDDKERLFARVAHALAPGGRAVFGDLMVANAATQRELQARFRATGDGDVADDMDDEHFWDIERCDAVLRQLGFELGWRRFSELSWVVCATKAG